jgi:hypothetical protein
MSNLALNRKALSEEAFSGAINAAGFDITALANKADGYDLTIKGFMAPGWTGRLTAALAEHRIGIVRGKAEKVTMSAWHSNFELKSPAPLANPLNIDYIALAGKELPSDRKIEKIALVEYVMEPANRHGGSLYVEVTGVDRLGFLGDLLDYFSMRCLFPVKMSVETVAGMAVDRFWLRGIGGSVPSEAITGAVRDNLESLLVTKGNA